jgi:hypothetical protein
MPLNVDSLNAGTISQNGEPVKPYKVYTALLTQSGGDDPQNILSGTVTAGVTYQIALEDAPIQSWDFSNVGGPQYPNGDAFVATSNGVPNNYGTATLGYNTGAPVATVLENTIGNVWFTYDSVGDYSIRSVNAFTVGKTYVSSQLNNNSNAYNTEFQLQDPSSDSIRLQAKDENWNSIDLDGFGIVLEIRVYN